jgi:hypothetical protein
LRFLGYTDDANQVLRVAAGVLAPRNNRPRRVLQALHHCVLRSKLGSRVSSLRIESIDLGLVPIVFIAGETITGGASHRMCKRTCANLLLTLFVCAAPIGALH